MGDPLVIACIALGLSVVASAVRMVDWFLHADPRIAARVTRWGAQGIAALSVPLLLVLLFKEQWTAATALASAMFLVPAVLGRRLWRLVGVPPLAAQVPWAPPHGRSPTRPSLSGIRRPCSRRICVAPPRRRRRSAAMCRRLRTTTDSYGGADGKGQATPQKATAEAATRTVTAMLVASPMRRASEMQRPAMAMPRASGSVRCPRRRRVRSSGSIAAPA